MLIKRRAVLSSIAGLGMAPLFCTSLAATEAASDLIMVVIYLGGGNDGLNTVIPLTQYGRYKTLRTPATPPPGLALAYPEDQLALLAFNSTYKTPATSATEYAFAPSGVALRDLYASGKLAVLAGVGLPRQEQNALSHANAAMDWFTGQININIGAQPPSGWLGLALDHITPGPLGAGVSVSGTTPLLNGNKTRGLVINAPIDNFGVSYGASDTATQLEGAFKRIAALTPVSPDGVAGQAYLQQSLADLTAVRALAHHTRDPKYPLDSWLDYQLRDIGRLIVGGAGMRGYFAAAGGFDTHSQQALTHPTLVQQLGQSLVNFYTYLSAQNATANVVVATVSDFGRRPQANLDFGTDHGGGTVSFVFGDRVRGGVYGAYPSLKNLDENGNLRATVDFRNVLADLIRAMGVPPPSFLGSWPRLGFI